DWERYAMVKARVMHGEHLPAARGLLSILRPFTYRVYVDYDAFDSLRSLKAMINAEVSRRGLENNVKLGSGGIREVEFIVQAFQLIRGGQDKILQTREIIKVLDIRAAEGYLPAAACTELREAYLFLRDSEHALQALNDEQTQLLPEDATAQARVALAMGSDDWPAYLQQLEQHRARVRLHFAQIVASDEDDQSNGDELQQWADMWLDDLDEQEQQAFLQQHPCPCNGFGEVQEQLRQFRESRAVLGMQQIGRERLDALMPLLLRELWQQPQPVVTLQRVMPLLEAVVRRTAYLVLLKENPQALTQLLKLCGASSWVAASIAQ